MSLHFPRYFATIAWIAMRLLLLEEFIVHENIELFDISILITFFSDIYYINSAVFCVASLGWPVKRNRRITIMVRLDMLLHIHFGWSDFVHSCRRTCATSWKIFLSQHERDRLLESELLWSANRKESLAHVPDSDLLSVLEAECGPHDIPARKVLKLVNESRFTRSLNPAEARRLWQYRRLNKRRGGSRSFMVCCPGQDPITHPQLSGTPVTAKQIKRAWILYGVHWCKRWK